MYKPAERWNVIICASLHLCMATWVKCLNKAPATYGWFEFGRGQIKLEPLVIVLDGAYTGPTG